MRTKNGRKRKRVKRERKLEYQKYKEKEKNIAKRNKKKEIKRERTDRCEGRNNAATVDVVYHCIKHYIVLSTSFTTIVCCRPGISNTTA